MKGTNDSAPASPPRLVRAVTSANMSPSSETATLTSVDDQSAASSSSSARKGRANRARTRSVSSNAVPVSQLGKATIAPIRVQKLGLDRGPGTPDYTLSASTPAWRRADLERNRTMSSLGQGLEFISEAERSAGPSRLSGPSDTTRRRSSSDASQSSSSSESRKKKAATGTSYVRPRLASLRSFLTSFSAGNSGNTPNTPSNESGVAEDVRSRTQRMTDQLQPLVMPSARPAALTSMGLNEDSPPLTPTSDPDEQSEYQQYVNAFRQQFVPKQVIRHHGPPKHQWSAAQAAADAAQAHIDEAASRWPFTPPLTASTAASPIPSSRAFSPPTRPDSSGIQSILPSHLTFSSRSTTPTSSTTTSFSDRPARSYNLFDVDTYRIESASKTISALLPRIQINLSSARLSFPNLRPFLPRLAFLFSIFAASTVCIVFMLSTLPLTLPKHITSLTLAEIKEIAMSLKLYSQSSRKAFFHTLVVLGTFFTWKQSFTVPGSLIMNVVFGAMYGTYSGTLYTSVLTAVGGVFCYLLSAPLGPLITSLPGLAKPLDAMRRALSPGRVRASGRSVGISSSNNAGNKDGNVWTYLLVLRVLPIVPYGLMNIACGVLGVPLVPYFGTLAVGSIPWNFVTCQVGDLLQEIVEALPVDDDMTVSGLGNKAKSSAGGGMRAIIDRIWNREMVVKLILLSIASLLPMLLSRWLKRKRQQEAERAGYEAVNGEEQERDDEESDRSESRRDSSLFEGKALPSETVEFGNLANHSSSRIGGSVGRNNSNSIRNAWL